jgi:hypothetical protein
MMLSGPDFTVSNTLIHEMLVFMLKTTLPGDASVVTLRNPHGAVNDSENPVFGSDGSSCVMTPTLSSERA